MVLPNKMALPKDGTNSEEKCEKQVYGKFWRIFSQVRSINHHHHRIDFKAISLSPKNSCIANLYQIVILIRRC